MLLVGVLGVTVKDFDLAVHPRRTVDRQCLYKELRQHRTMSEHVGLDSQPEHNWDAQLLSGLGPFAHFLTIPVSPSIRLG